MIKIVPLLLSISVSSVASNGSRGLVDRPIISKPGPITVSSISSQIEAMSRSHYYPPISFPIFESEEIIISSSSQVSSSSSSSASNPNQDYFFCEKYGPFIEDERNKEITFTYELYSIESQRIIERVRLIKDKDVLAGFSKGAFYYTKGARREATFFINLFNYLNNNGLELHFEIINASSYQVLKEYSASIYPPSKSRVLATSLKREIYTSRSLGFYGDGTKMVEIKDNFDFTRFGDFVDNDYYYRLDIGRNAFYTASEEPIQCASAYLRFYDDDYLFPNFTHQDNDEIVLPLKIYQRNERLSFLFVDKFYVDKKTLDVSDVYQPNYIITSSFYLPINGLNKFNGKTIYIDINGLGLDEISTTISLKYELNRLIVGSCENGEYCVHGGTM